MHICAHRGFWTTPAEGNTLSAFERAFRAGVGVELDVRDAAGRLVVAHDPPDDRATPPDFEDVLRLHRRWAPDACLAVNVKAAGLHALLGELIRAYEVRDYFAFDMAVPDMFGYAAAGLTFFTRQSELEDPPALLDRAAGVWVDGFHTDWATADVLSTHWGAGKRVAFVSPELHGRANLPVWDMLRGMSEPATGGLILCTDFPEAARGYFRA